MKKKFVKVMNKDTGVVFGLYEDSFDPKIMIPVEEEVVEPMEDEEDVPVLMTEQKKEPKPKATRKKKAKK